VAFSTAKQTLAIATFAYILTLPFVSSASSIVNQFLTSSTGTAYIDIGDTIQFEVTISLNSEQPYRVAVWTLSGDTENASSSSPNSDWVGVRHIVQNWDWHYTNGSGAGGNKVKMGTNGRILPFVASAPPPNRVTGLYGFLENKTGNGIPAMVGTVTILADEYGYYRGGGYLQPGIGKFGSLTVSEVVTISGGQFTVNFDAIPEPSTALLLTLGMVGLAATRKWMFLEARDGDQFHGKRYFR
jgi:hypothetical protein